MTKKQRNYKRYSICFKQKAVEEVSSGRSISEVCRRYGITGTNTVQRWLKLFGREELLNTVIRIEMKGEKDRLKELEAENRRLKLALADKIIAVDVLEHLVSIAEKQYGIDLKKNTGEKR